MFVVSERNQGVVALHQPTKPLNTRSRLDPLPKWLTIPAEKFFAEVLYISYHDVLMNSSPTVYWATKI